MDYIHQLDHLGGGESLDVILDASDATQYPAGSKFYLYTPNLDHLSNDAENFGGLMTEVHDLPSVSRRAKASSATRRAAMTRQQDYVRASRWLLPHAVGSCCCR